MIRWSVLVAGTVLAAAAAFVAGASVPTKDAKPPMEAKAEVAKPQVVVGQKTGYFNMAKVMREFKRAKTSVEKLNTQKTRLSADLLTMRNKYIELQKKVAETTDQDDKDKLSKQLVSLARKIEDEDKDINKMLNDKASVIIASLYDDMHAVVEAIAHEKGLVAVLAYPDAVTKGEQENPYIKELKLKPPAAQPFYLDPSVEYSDEIIRRLNEKFDADNKD